MPSIHNNLKIQPFKTNTKLQQITERLKHLIYIIQFVGMTDIKKITTVISGGRKAGTHQNPPISPSSLEKEILFEIEVVQ